MEPIDFLAGSGKIQGVRPTFTHMKENYYMAILPKRFRKEISYISQLF